MLLIVDQSHIGPGNHTEEPLGIIIIDQRRAQQPAHGKRIAIFPRIVDIAFTQSESRGHRHTGTPPAVEHPVIGISQLDRIILILDLVIEPPRRRQFRVGTLSQIPKIKIVFLTPERQPCKKRTLAATLNLAVEKRGRL